jgi:transcriptional regulator with XRE-family HTH domain
MASDTGSTYDSRISARVREIRELRGLSQRQLAELVGLAQSVYARYEKGRRNGWPVSMLVDVADALQVPLVVLVPGERVVCQVCGTDRGMMRSARVSASDD